MPVGLGELVVVFVIGLLILGPERLPRVATQIGRWVGRARRTANQLRYQLEREITLADIEGKKKEKEQENRKSKESGQTSDQAASEATSPDLVKPAAESEPPDSASPANPDARGD